MNLVWFYIILVIAVVGIISMLFIEFPVCNRVKAGIADKYVFGKTVARRIQKISIGDRQIDASKLSHMVVAGDSMKDYNINDGDNVLIETFNSQQKKNITRYPVVVISLREPRKPFDSDMKLRKFVGYVDDENWGDTYERYRDRVKADVTKDDFVASCQKSYGKYQFPLASPRAGVLSETYDADEQSYHYSVHSSDSIYGKVVYVGK